MVARCEVGLKIPAGARVERAVLAPAGRGGPLHVRRRRAVRAAVSADAVHRAADLRGGRRGDRRGRRRAARFSIATKATSSAARSGPSCSWSRRSRCACRRTSPSSRRVRSAPRVRWRPPPAARFGPTPTGRELRVSVVNDGQGAAENVVTLQLPAGWTATPPQQTMKFARQDESQTVRFSVKPAPNTVPGEYHVRAIVSSGGQTFDARLPDDRVSRTSAGSTSTTTPTSP